MTNPHRNPPDPVDQALEAIASQQWGGAADWPAFKSRLVRSSARRFAVIRRRPMLFSVLAAAGLCATAAAVATVYQSYQLRGTARMEDGTIRHFEAHIVTLDGEEGWSIDHQGLPDGPATGTADMTMPSGETVPVQVIFPAGSEDFEKAVQEARKQMGPPAPKQ